MPCSSCNPARRANAPLPPRRGVVARPVETYVRASYKDVFAKNRNQLHRGNSGAPTLSSIPSNVSFTSNVSSNVSFASSLDTSFTSSHVPNSSAKVGGGSYVSALPLHYQQLIGNTIMEITREGNRFPEEKEKEVQTSGEGEITRVQTSGEGETTLPEEETNREDDHVQVTNKVHNIQVASTNDVSVDDASLSSPAPNSTRRSAPRPPHSSAVAKRASLPQQLPPYLAILQQLERGRKFQQLARALRLQQPFGRRRRA